jgi:hypothetical protein
MTCCFQMARKVDKSDVRSSGSVEIGASSVGIAELSHIKADREELRAALADISSLLAEKANVADIRHWLDVVRDDVERMVSTLRHSLRHLEVTRY